MGVNPSAQYSAAAMGHGSYRPLHPQQHAQQQQQQHYPHQQQQQAQPPMRSQQQLAPQQQQQPGYGALNGPSAAATAAAAKNIPPNSYGATPAAPVMHPQYPHGSAYGSAPAPIRPAMYSADSNTLSGHPQQQQHHAQQQQQPKPYQPYSMQSSYSMGAHQQFGMSESTAQQQPHTASQPAQVPAYFLYINIISKFKFSYALIIFFIYIATATRCVNLVPTATSGIESTPQHAAL